MTTLPRWARPALLAAALLPVALLARSTLASELIALDLPTLGARAELVVRARITHVTGRASSDGRRIVSDVEATVLESLKGAEDAQAVQFTVPGGVAGDVGQRVIGAPSFIPGEEVVLFLERSAGGSLRVLGLSQGVLRVVREDGVARLVREQPRGLRLVQPDQRGRADPDSPSPSPWSSLAAGVRTEVPGRQESVCLRWPGGSTLVFRPEACGGTDPRCAERQQAMARAVATWSAALQPSSLRLSLGEPTTTRDVGKGAPSETENVFVTRSKRCEPAAQGDCWGHGAETISLTTTTFSWRTGVIIDADLELNDTQGKLTTVDGPRCEDVDDRPPCMAHDVEGAVTHELGHALGLDHNADPTSSMYPSNASRTIDAATRAELLAIYPPGADSVPCGEVLPDSEDHETSKPLWQGLGCVTATGGGLPLALAALSALAFVARRRGGAR